MVTPQPFIARNRPTKSLRWKGSSFSSAASRRSLVSERIISRIAIMRSPSKNMCSVRHSPMPSAPKSRARWASLGVSALVRTPRVRYLSAQRITLAKSPESSGSRVGIEPAITSPVDPSIEIRS